MASSYNPDPSTEASDTLYTALLSQRDLSSRIPINYVTAPGVALTPVCFSDRVYEDAAAQQCLSNLLSIGFHRLIVDLYWDQSRQTWSLCPVELSNEGNSTSPIRTGAFPSSLSTSSSSTSPSATLTVARFSGATAERLVREPLHSSLINAEEDVHRRTGILARQTPEDSSELMTALSTDSASLATVVADGSPARVSEVSMTVTSQSTAAARPSETGRHQIGGYSCTESIGLTTLTEVLADYFSFTENDLNATFKYLELNVRLAAPFDDPTNISSSPDPERLPTLGNYLSDLINSTLSPYLYTPFALRTERANLNDSWFSGAINNPPASEYINTMPLSDGSGLYTLDGWPSESVIMLQRALRLVANIGSVDSQMQQYDFGVDADTIFPTGYVSNTIDTTLSADGGVTEGCLYQSRNYTLSNANSSWAVSSSLPNTTSLNTTSYAAANLSSCGISPVLNKPLIGTLARDNATLYREFIRDSLWGWADDEPSDSDASEATGSRHCAVTNASNDGLWEVVDCTDENHFVCRRNDSPYTFSVSDSKARYYQGDQACGEDISFAVPRTALENRYMVAAVRDWISRQSDFDDQPVFWLNINDIDTRDCWVSGVDQTCPYRSDLDSDQKSIVIPTVAGVIVFLLAILTLFVKCAANRQNTRRRRKRTEGGWEYEGVPS
ncbi:hypothetical protein AUEXF2481DRAFT_2764 [Aureobasidium subglaciale EXF-2481]|uniref:Maintenance of telomere capping protein 6 n=1 Tax=Aureobasidium subglaciale (strain EXF-2481) TaxID=1043005 RepID=A0A074YNY4_AURSE|nr:uncharacterized protein AUEXF2481DRAFT_2764 [Aureobasidium subglaciale EXF-2481]KAI5197405.1 hypothetical protein E4T38_07977 [Aureobasidium subglaciale]KAI5216310.1 hypothetical protein E4T40_07987 [Aureobasidium subglaciale]KAI5219584.1 hypothetical protein E4T41_07902 [Aureobasidium subglaciale]KAI5257602.1 hypothetical protein E4T46_07878 [Aureobasidium subglaciale]KEQ97844.1 hypothetical protein AUEXF2481DRAFT_2764 [Aureobasidium subglaciale EXF-2481]